MGFIKDFLFSFRKKKVSVKDDACCSSPEGEVSIFPEHSDSLKEDIVQNEVLIDEEV